MANAKAVGPDELPVELLKRGLHHDSRVLQEVHKAITRDWRVEKASEKWRYNVIKDLHNKKDRAEYGNHCSILSLIHI